MQDKNICVNCGSVIPEGTITCCICNDMEDVCNTPDDFRMNVLQTLCIVTIVTVCIITYYATSDILWLMLLQIGAAYIIVRRYK